MAKIQNMKDYYNIEDGTILVVCREGDGWEEDTGTVEKVIKFDDKLYAISGGYYDVTERDDPGYEFSIIKRGVNDEYSL